MLSTVSLERHADTIVAPITAPGGAVALVRLSGPQSWKIASQLFDSWDELPRTALYGHYSTGDDGLITPFEEGSSYTGEQSVEMSVHGSLASINALIDVCLQAGTRLAEPGEFTLRAFMNGKLDLTQAEGVRDTVNAQSSAQLEQANQLREGTLSEEVRLIREPLMTTLTAVEASTDFSEEIGELDVDLALANCRIALERTDRLLETKEAAHLKRHGITLAIAGRPNAGKSSLLNRLTGEDRAIVTEVPGTTRDTIEEVVVLGGLACRVVDTAGLRNTTDVVEKEGIQRTETAIKGADAVWYVYDTQAGWTQEDTVHCPAGALVVANKSDLAKGDGIAVSAKTGAGMSELIKQTVEWFKDAANQNALINERHFANLTEAKEAVSRSIQTLQSDAPTDLAAVDLRAAIRNLDEITGQSTPANVIDQIFKDFCIGK